MTEKSKRGGARPGAGRPKGETPPLKTYTLRLPADVIDWCRGNTDKVRAILARAARRKK